MALRLEPREAIATLDAFHTRQAEHVLFHPTRGTVVSITNTALQEIDLATGALVGEIDFDVTSIVASATGSAPPAATASDKVHVLDHVTAVGRSAVVAVLYSRYLVVWDLHEHVLQSVSEVERLQKSTTAIAGSLCKDQWVFYASEGSASVKVTRVDSRDAPKKISRKAANRSSHITALAYSTPKRLLCCGSSDGIVQFWSFAEDNALGGKDESASATLLFASPTMQSPVVQLTFATTAANAHYLFAGYQNRAIEVWATFVSGGSASKPRDPQRVAVTQLSQQQAVDFAKKSGVLSFSLHSQLPLLVAHWHSFHSSSSAIAWEFSPSIGGGSGASGSSGALSEWCELIAASVRAASVGGGTRVEEDASTHVAGVSWSQDALVCYRSSSTRSLFTLGVTDASADSGSTWAAPLEGPSLCSKFTLSLEQYWSYQDMPANLVQITANPEPSSGAAEFVLHHTSLQTGASEKLDDLPAWKNYQGKVLAPWIVVANPTQSIVCVKLRERSKPQRSLRSAQHPTDDGSFSYVVLEIKEKTGGGSSRRREDLDGGDGSANFRVSCGSQLEALDVCFADSRSEDARQSCPWVLVVLASTGKSLCVQVKCDQVESSRILLQRDVLRVFSSPVPLSPQSPYSSVVGSRLVYVSVDSTDGRQVLQLSEDDLSIPHASAPGTWKTRGVDEAILDVKWNSSPAATASSSSDSDLLVAVRTTKRVVVLTRSLVQVQTYDLARDLADPQSMLWMVQTLLFVTRHNHLRYVTPLRRDSERSRLVCCLSEADRSTAQHTELLSVCGDRLAYAVTDVRTLASRVLLRPVSICDPLAAGFATPNSKLKAIVEREVLVFAMTGGSESSSPLTDRLLHILYHDFSWKDTTIRLLDAVTNLAAGGGGGSSAAAISGGAASSSYPKTANLSAPLLASLYLDSHRWREFLKVFLASDPGLEEYALAAEDSASSAKLPSRTGPTATKFRAFGRILAAVGQSELAIKCFDLAGDDLAIVAMAREVDASSMSSLVTSLQKDWAKLNPPLASLVSAEKAAGSAEVLAQLNSVVWRRHDHFSLLCCESLVLNERRSRLLSSVKPFDTMTVASKKETSSAETTLAPCPRASVLPWKRLAPEDARDWIGVSATPHFSSDEPKNPSYGFSASSSSALGVGGSSLPLGAAPEFGDAAGGDTGAGASASGVSNASAKMTIGPFVDEEDAVVAYWRFEEGAGLVAGEGAVESLDTSKRENNLQLLDFGTALSLQPSSAPVDKGEDGRVQDEYALRFPSSGSEENGALESEWGAKCTVRSGSTLDIGFVFDDDPYRRKLTFEAWLRNFELAQQQQQQEQESDEFETPPPSSSSPSSPQLADAGSRAIVCRKSSASDRVWWSFSLVGGYLVLEFAGQSITSDERVANAAAWHHAAFSIDVQSPKQAALKLFLQGRCVGAKEVSGVDSVNAKIYASAADAAAESGDALSYLLLGGSQLRSYEMTEVRVWAAARTQDQLSDMKENYLGIAEAKKRMKIAIHQRNCQCDKCHARRAKPAAAKLGLPMLSTPFPSTPPSSGSARDRRRPPPK